MENKEIATSGKMSLYLIGYWLLWGIPLGIIYTFLFSIISHSISSLLLQAIISIVLQGIMAIILWKLSTSSAFKKRTISSEDVSTVIKNLLIFTIAICMLTAINNISKVNSQIDNAINSNFELKLRENMMTRLYNEKQINEYNQKKEKAISDVKSQLYTYLIILEIGLTVVYLSVLPIEKKELLKYAQ